MFQLSNLLCTLRLAFTLCFVSLCGESPRCLNDIIYFNITESRATTQGSEEYPACFVFLYIQKDSFPHHTQIFHIRYHTQLSLQGFLGFSWLRGSMLQPPPQGQPWGFSCPVSLPSDCKPAQVFTCCGHEIQTGCKRKRERKKKIFCPHFSGSQ